jgi:hypothetical protein
VIANPTPVALRSAIALAILIRLLAAVVIIPARTGSPDVADRWPRSPRAIKKDRSHGWVAIVSVTSSPGQAGTCLPRRSNAAAPAETIRFSCADALAAPPYPPPRSARPIGSPSGGRGGMQRYRTSFQSPSVDRKSPSCVPRTRFLTMTVSPSEMRSKIGIVGSEIAPHGR